MSSTHTARPSASWTPTPPSRPQAQRRPGLVVALALIAWVMVTAVITVATVTIATTATDSTLGPDLGSALTIAVVTGAVLLVPTMIGIAIYLAVSRARDLVTRYRQSADARR